MSRQKSRAAQEDVVQTFATRSFQYNQGSVPSSMSSNAQLTHIEELLSITVTNNQETPKNETDKKYIYPSIIPQFCEEIGDYKSFDRDTQRWLAEITENLEKSIKTRNFGNSYKQFYYYNQKLLSYITMYGYRMTKQKLIDLTMLYYRLFIDKKSKENLKLMLLTIQVLKSLLSVPRRLLEEDDIILDWKPLMELYNYYMHSNEIRMTYDAEIYRKIAAQISNILVKSNKHFTELSNFEIENFTRRRFMLAHGLFNNDEKVYLPKSESTINGFTGLPNLSNAHSCYTSLLPASMRKEKDHDVNNETNEEKSDENAEKSGKSVKTLMGVPENHLFHEHCDQFFERFPHKTYSFSGENVTIQLFKRSDYLKDKPECRIPALKKFMSAYLRRLKINTKAKRDTVNLRYDTDVSCEEYDTSQYAGVIVYLLGHDKSELKTLNLRRNSNYSKINRDSMNQSCENPDFNNLSISDDKDIENYDEAGFEQIEKFFKLVKNFFYYSNANYKQLFIFLESLVAKVTAKYWSTINPTFDQKVYAEPSDTREITAGDVEKLTDIALPLVELGMFAKAYKMINEKILRNLAQVCPGKVISFVVKHLDYHLQYSTSQSESSAVLQPVLCLLRGVLISFTDFELTPTLRFIEESREFGDLEHVVDTSEYMMSLIEKLVDAIDIILDWTKSWIILDMIRTILNIIPAQNLFKNQENILAFNEKMITVLLQLEKHYASAGQGRDDSANSGQEGANMSSISIFHEILTELVHNSERETAIILRNRYFNLIRKTSYQTDVMHFLPFVVSVVTTAYDLQERNKVLRQVLISLDEIVEFCDNELVYNPPSANKFEPTLKTSLSLTLHLVSCLRFLDGLGVSDSDSLIGGIVKVLRLLQRAEFMKSKLAAIFTQQLIMRIYAKLMADKYSCIVGPMSDYDSPDSSLRTVYETDADKFVKCNKRVQKFNKIERCDENCEKENNSVESMSDTVLSKQHKISTGWCKLVETQKVVFRMDPTKLISKVIKPELLDKYYKNLENLIKTNPLTTSEDVETMRYCLTAFSSVCKLVGQFVGQTNLSHSGFQPSETTFNQTSMNNMKPVIEYWREKLLNLSSDLFEKLLKSGDQHAKQAELFGIVVQMKRSVLGVANFSTAAHHLKEQAAHSYNGVNYRTQNWEINPLATLSYHQFTVNYAHSFPRLERLNTNTHVKTNDNLKNGIIRVFHETKSKALVSQAAVAMHYLLYREGHGYLMVDQIEVNLKYLLMNAEIKDYPEEETFNLLTYAATVLPQLMISKPWATIENFLVCFLKFTDKHPRLAPYLERCYSCFTAGDAKVAKMAYDAYLEEFCFDDFDRCWKGLFSFWRSDDFAKLPVSRSVHFFRFISKCLVFKKIGKEKLEEAFAMFIPLVIGSDHARIRDYALQVVVVLMYILKDKTAPYKWLSIENAKKMYDLNYDYAKNHNSKIFDDEKMDKMEVEGESEWFCDNNRFRHFMLLNTTDHLIENPLEDKPVKLYTWSKTWPSEEFKSSKVYKQTYSIVTKPDFLDRYFTLYCETSPNNPYHFLFWHRVAQCLGPVPLKGIIDDLMEKYPGNERLGFTALAMNILSGIKTGGKNWPKADFREVSSRYVDLCLRMMYSKNREFTVKGFSLAVANRDQKRDPYFFQTILKEKLIWTDETTPANLALIAFVKNEFNNHETGLDKWIWERVIKEKNLLSSYHANVRHEVIKIVGMIITSYRTEVSIDEILESYLKVIGDLKDFNPQSKVNQSDEQDLKNGALKIILLLCTKLLKSENHGYVSAFEKLIPYTLKVVNLRGTPTDQGVETVCRRFLRQIVSTIVVDEKEQLEYFELWQRNSKYNVEMILNLLPLFTWMNVFLISPAVIQKQLKFALKHLETEHTAENTKFIRKAAAKLVSAMFQVGLVTNKTIHKKLSKCKNVHGKICVLTSLILTEPYDVPKWLPELFVQLSHYSGDKQVSIKSEVEDCVKEFKRTHTVGWDVVYKPKFNEEQLEALYELGEMPSYFV